MLKHVLLVFFLTFAAPLAFAQEGTFDDAFRAGLKSYQNKDFPGAEAHFLKALEFDPRNTAAMVNLALAYAQASKPGHAIAWFRRALSVDPSFTQAREGLEYSLSKLDVKEIPHRIELFETLRSGLLQYFSLTFFLGLGLFLLAGTGWSLLSWWGRRRRALQTPDEIPPSFPVLTGLLILIFLVNTAATGLKLFEATQSRGTIVTDKVSALSAPSQDGVSLFELHQGFEVLIQEIKGEWVQVTYPGGLTGWIPKADLIPLEGRRP